MIAKRLMTLMLVLAVTLATAHSALAQAARKPVAVMSVSSIEGVLGGVEYLMEAGGAKDLGEMASGMALGWTMGIDKQKPIGVLILSEGQEFVPLAFVSVKDMKQVMSLISDNLGKPREAGNGVMEIDAGPQPIFMKEQNGIAFIGQTVESLRELPANPMQTLGNLPQKYDIAFRGNVANVPAAYLDMAITTIRDGIKAGLDQLPEEERAAQAEMAKIQMEQIETYVRESEEITMGWKVDPAQKHAFLDMGFVARQGTSLAKQMASMADPKSDFSGFMLPDAAMTMSIASKIPEEQIPLSVKAIENIRETALRQIDQDEDLETPEAREAAKEMTRAALDIVVETIKSGKIDGATSIVLAPKSMQMVGGFHVADGAAVDKMLRRIVELAESEPDFPGVKFDADKQGDVAFHVMSVPVPEGEDARKVLGDTLEISVGIGKTSTYIGFGKGSLAKLKNVIADSKPNAKVQPFAMTFAMKPIMDFVASIESNPMVGAMSDAVKESGDKDQVKILGMPVPNGFVYRIEMEEGVMRAIGSAAEMSGAPF